MHRLTKFKQPQSQTTVHYPHQYLLTKVLNCSNKFISKRLTTMGKQRKNSKCLLVEIVKNSKQVDLRGCKGGSLWGNDRGVTED